MIGMDIISGIVFIHLVFFAWLLWGYLGYVIWATYNPQYGKRHMMLPLMMLGGWLTMGVVVVLWYREKGNVK